MNNLILLQFLANARAVQSEVSLGLIVLTIIEMPVLILILASILGRPRQSKVTGLFLGYLFSMFFVFVAFMYLIGVFQGFFF